MRAVLALGPGGGVGTLLGEGSGPNKRRAPDDSQRFRPMLAPAGDEPHATS